MSHRSVACRAFVLLFALGLATIGPHAKAIENTKNEATGVTAALEELGDWVQLFREAQTPGPALKPLLPRETILSISSHLTPEAARLLVQRLSDPRTLTRIGIDRPTVNQLIEGLQLVTPLLDEIEPQIQVVVTRQTFEGVRAVPDVKLPAVALVFRPRDPSRAKRLLLSAYLLAMQQANEAARKEGKPPLRMESERRGAGFYAASTFRLPENPDPKIVGLADFNLSPAIGVVRDRMILASSRQQVIELVDLASAEQGGSLERESLRFDLGSAALLQLAADNSVPVVDALSLNDRCEALDACCTRMHATVQRGLERLPRRTIAVRFEAGLPWPLARRGS